MRRQLGLCPLSRRSGSSRRRSARCLCGNGSRRPNPHGCIPQMLQGLGWVDIGAVFATTIAGATATPIAGTPRRPCWRNQHRRRRRSTVVRAGSDRSMGAEPPAMSTCILRGEKPADLPVQALTKYEFGRQLESRESDRGSTLPRTDASRARRLRPLSGPAKPKRHRPTPRQKITRAVWVRSRGPLAFTS